MTSTPKRPASACDQRDRMIRRMLATATGKAQRVRPDPTRVDPEGRLCGARRPITLATAPWRDPDKR
jgi:hypothetical protein